MEPRQHSLAPGELFEVPIDIKAPSILQFSFSTSEGGSVEFSVVHKAGGKKSNETTLLPASTYTENIGEVLLRLLPARAHALSPSPQQQPGTSRVTGAAARPRCVCRPLPQPDWLVLLVSSKGPLLARRRPDTTRRREAQ